MKKPLNWDFFVLARYSVMFNFFSATIAKVEIMNII